MDKGLKLYSRLILIDIRLGNTVKRDSIVWNTVSDIKS